MEATSRQGGVQISEDQTQRTVIQNELAMYPLRTSDLSSSGNNDIKQRID
jgi:hypothetical protein